MVTGFVAIGVMTAAVNLIPLVMMMVNREYFWGAGWAVGCAFWLSAAGFWWSAIVWVDRHELW